MCFLHDRGPEMITTGMNHIINPGEQSLSRSALLESWFFFFLGGGSVCLFCDSYFLKRCSVYATAADGYKS